MIRQPQELLGLVLHRLVFSRAISPQGTGHMRGDGELEVGWLNSRRQRELRALVISSV